MYERQAVLAVPPTGGRTMASRIKARSLAVAPLVVALSGIVTGCSGAAVDGAVAAPSKSTVTLASQPLETMVPIKAPGKSTCKGLVPEVVSIAGVGKSNYPEIVGISGLKVVKDRQADYRSGALQATAKTPQVVVLTCRGTAAWDDKSRTGVQFQLLYDINGGRAVLYQRM